MMRRFQCSLLLLMACLCAMPSFAANGLTPDVRLLIDVSAGMKASDPKNMRKPALDLLVRLLPDGSKAGIWVFAEEAAPLVAHGVVDDAWREQAREAISGLKSTGKRTNIPAALEQATIDLKSPEPGYRSSVVLLTAGRIDVAESPIINVSESRKLLNGLAVELGSQGVPVHTIAFSREADAMLLRSLARETKGTSRQARSADELSAMFMRVMEMVAPVAQVPLEGQQFVVDERVQRFSVLTFFPGGKGKLKVIDPDGVVLTSQDESGGVEWFRKKQFALATLDNPARGTWRLQIPSRAFARALVVSDLELDVGLLPHYVAAGHEAEVTFRLIDQSEVIKDPAVLSGFDVTLEVKGPQGKTEVVAVGDSSSEGVYRVVTPSLEQPGRYQLLLRVNAASLKRELPIYLEVGVPAEQPTLVTRGQELPEDDFQAPLMWLAGVCAVILFVVWLILRRRKQRKLALWQKRAREISGNGQSRTIPGAPSVKETADRLD
ncbi:MAG: vWA domain-containing protein [Halioglobus sp.]